MVGREEIVQQALALPPEDRAFVAAVLKHSLTPDAGDQPSPDSHAVVAGSELLEELKRRSEAVRMGATTTRTAADVLADMLQRQAAENGR